MITLYLKCEKCGNEATVKQNREEDGWDYDGYKYRWPILAIKDTHKDSDDCWNLGWGAEKRKEQLLCPTCFEKYGKLLRKVYEQSNKEILEFFDQPISE